MIIYGNGFLREVSTSISYSLEKARPVMISFVRIVNRGKGVGDAWNVLEAECSAVSVAGKPIHFFHSIGWKRGKEPILNQRGSGKTAL